MEYFFDHLSLPNGQQVTIPFILTLAFSSNLDPEKISDPAFLRRLGYKIQFYPLHEQEYRALWEDFAKSKGLSVASVRLKSCFIYTINMMWVSTHVYPRIWWGLAATLLHLKSLSR